MLNGENLHYPNCGMIGKSAVIVLPLIPTPKPSFISTKNTEKIGFRRLRGMFAIALWDSQERKALARQGSRRQKPLFLCGRFQAHHLRFRTESFALPPTACPATSIEKRSADYFSFAATFRRRNHLSRRPQSSAWPLSGGVQGQHSRSLLLGSFLRQSGRPHGRRMERAASPRIVPKQPASA